MVQSPPVSPSLHQFPEIFQRLLKAAACGLGDENTTLVTRRTCLRLHAVISVVFCCCRVREIFSCRRAHNFSSWGQNPSLSAFNDSCFWLFPSFGALSCRISSQLRKFPPKLADTPTNRKYYTRTVGGWGIWGLHVGECARGYMTFRHQCLWLPITVWKAECFSPRMRIRP